jgi:hypothetical protein
LTAKVVYSFNYNPFARTKASTYTKGSLNTSLRAGSPYLSDLITTRASYSIAKTLTVYSSTNPNLLCLLSLNFSLKHRTLTTSKSHYYCLFTSIRSLKGAQIITVKQATCINYTIEALASQTQTTKTNIILNSVALIVLTTLKITTMT